MPLSIPNHQTIRTRMIDEAVSLTGDASLREAAHPINILLTAITNPIADLYAQTNKIIADSFITTATDDALDVIGRNWGLIRMPAVKAKGTVRIDASEGSNIPAGTLISTQAGIRYETKQSATIDASLSAMLEVIALLGGRTGNAPAGSEFRLVNPIAGVNSLLIAQTAVIGGETAENDSVFRARILARVRAPARSGNDADYKFWALNAGLGVTRAWVIPRATGAGTVKLLVMRDNADSTGTGELSAIKASIDNVRPIGAEVTVALPTLKPTNIKITNLYPQNDTIVQNAIKDNLKNLFLRGADPGGTIHLSQISEAISSANGEVSHTLSSPANNQTSTAQQLLTLGEVTFL